MPQGVTELDTGLAKGGKRPVEMSQVVAGPAHPALVADSGGGGQGGLRGGIPVRPLALPPRGKSQEVRELPYLDLKPVSGLFNCLQQNLMLGTEPGIVAARSVSCSGVTPGLGRAIANREPQELGRSAIVCR